jgi:hypothetical protein
MQELSGELVKKKTQKTWISGLCCPIFCFQRLVTRICVSIHTQMEPGPGFTMSSTSIREPRTLRRRNESHPQWNESQLWLRNKKLNSKLKTRMAAADMLTFIIAVEINLYIH